MSYRWKLATVGTIVPKNQKTAWKLGIESENGDCWQKNQTIDRPDVIL